MVSRRSRTRRAIERLTLDRSGWPPRLREALTVGSGLPFEEQDRAALAGHGGKEQVEHVLEQVRQRPMGEQRPRRLAQHLQHAVLPEQLLRIDGGLGLDVRQLLGREDARPLGGLRVLLHVLDREGQHVLAQRDHVAVAQATVAVHGLPVEERPVLAAQVVQEEARVLAQDLGVVAREPLVGQEDVAVAGAANGHPLLGEREPLARPFPGVYGNLGHWG
jgi:hypothetical protein